MSTLCYQLIDPSVILFYFIWIVRRIEGIPGLWLNLSKNLSISGPTHTTH